VRTVPALACGLVLVVAPAACSDADGTSASSTSTTAAGPFCAAVARIAATDLGANFTSGDEDDVADALAVLDDLRPEVPAAIADDYAVIIDFVEVVLDDFDLFHDPDRAEELAEEQAEAIERFGEAVAEVDELTLAECGVTMAGARPDATLETFAGHVESCRAGDMHDCDTLYAETPFGSLAEAVALECGGVAPGGGHRGDCEDTFD
jgi:hypothetical protein